jgi:TrmH family RNA methyltransferase
MAPTITSAANPRYKLARALLTRRGRQKHRRLLLEGPRLISDSISAGFPPALVLFDEAAAAALAPVLTAAAAAGADVLSLKSELLAELCQTVTPQGVVAVAPWPEVVPGNEGWSLIVDGMQDPGNVGTLLRSAAAAGLDQVILLPGVTDPWAPKVLRAGMGAHFRVAIRLARDLAQVEAWIGPAQRLLATAAAPTLYTEIDWTRPSALVVGSEAEGPRLTASWSGLREVAIPMARGMESLNAAVAGSVILFEAQRQRRARLRS